MGEKGIHFFKQQEFQIVWELSGRFPVKRICRVMGVNRSGFYKWKKRLENPSKRAISFAADKVYPNLLLTGLKVEGPLQCIVSDMTAFHFAGTYYRINFFHGSME